MAKLYFINKKTLQFDDNFNGYWDYPVFCGNCKEELTQVNWEWWSYCANCGAKLDNVEIISNALEKLNDQ